MGSVVYFTEHNIFGSRIHINGMSFILKEGEYSVFMEVNGQLIRCSESLIDQLFDEVIDSLMSENYNKASASYMHTLVVYNVHRIINKYGL